MAGIQGRGSAISAALFAAMLFAILLPSDGAVYTVGDQRGWTFNTALWSQAKRFLTGDQIIFKYNPMLHNVVAVDAAGYKACKANRGSKVFSSGSDRVTLRKGTNYFICSVPGHCDAGMKLAIVAA